MNEEEKGRLITAVECARLLGVSWSWVIRHSAPSAKFRIPVMKVGGLLRYDPEQVLACIRNANATPKSVGV